jgi:hypothetical protein
MKIEKGEDIHDAMERYRAEQAARPWIVRYSEEAWYRMVEAPIDLVKDCLRETKWAYQRVVRGYDDSFKWSYSYEHAVQARDILKWLKENKLGTPLILEEANFAEPWTVDYAADEKAWNEILNKMIAGYEALIAMEDVQIRKEDGTFDPEATMAEYKRLEMIWQEGGALYVKHVRSLWD